MVTTLIDSVQQSVRHHLSLNRLFERQARPVTEPGFGSYWTVNLDAPPGTKRPRKRGRPKKEGEGGETQVRRRGRPKKCSREGYDYEPELDLPPIATLPVPAIGSPPQQSMAEPQKRARPSHEDDDEEVLEREGSSLDGPSFQNSDDAYESDVDMAEDSGEWSPSLEQHTFPASPRMLDKSPCTSDPASKNKAESLIDRLQNEVRELRRQAAVASTVSARLSDELAYANSEITKLRSENELLERRLETEGSRKWD